MKYLAFRTRQTPDRSLREKSTRAYNSRCAIGFPSASGLSPTKGWTSEEKMTKVKKIQVFSKSLANCKISPSPFVLPHQASLWTTKYIFRPALGPLSTSPGQLMDHRIHLQASLWTTEHIIRQVYGPRSTSSGQFMDHRAHLTLLSVSSCIKTWFPWRQGV